MFKPMPWPAEKFAEKLPCTWLPLELAPACLRPLLWLRQGALAPDIDLPGAGLALDIDLAGGALGLEIDLVGIPVARDLAPSSLSELSDTR